MPVSPSFQNRSRTRPADISGRAPKRASPGIADSLHCVAGRSTVAGTRRRYPNSLPDTALGFQQGGTGQVDVGPGGIFCSPLSPRYLFNTITPNIGSNAFTPKPIAICGFKKKLSSTLLSSRNNIDQRPIGIFINRLTIRPGL